MISKEAVLDKMKAAGLRQTPQRVHIVDLLFRLSHPTAERIYSMLAEAFPSVSPMTVYSTLKVLKELGVVRELSNGNKSSHFEWAETDHWHFTCKACGEIYDLEPHAPETLLSVGSNQGRFQVDSYRVEFYGVCTKCEA